MNPELDHENRPVPADEGPDAVIKVWQVSTPDDPSGYDYYTVRGWQAMLDFVRGHVERALEDSVADDDEGPEVRLSVKLVSMTRREYDDIYEND